MLEEEADRATVLAVYDPPLEVGVHPAMIAGRVRHEQGNHRLLSQLVGSGKVRRQFERGERYFGRMKLTLAIVSERGFEPENLCVLYQSLRLVMFGTADYGSDLILALRQPDSEKLSFCQSSNWVKHNGYDL